MLQTLLLLVPLENTDNLYGRLSKVIYVPERVLYSWCSQIVTKNVNTNRLGTMGYSG